MRKYAAVLYMLIVTFFFPFSFFHMFLHGSLKKLYGSFLIIFLRENVLRSLDKKKKSQDKKDGYDFKIIFYLTRP